MKKILTILTFFTFILIGCGGSSAEKTAVDFTQTLYTSNTKPVVDMLYLGDEKPSKADMDFVFQKIDSVLEQNKAKAKERGGFKKADVIKKDIDGNTASIRVQTTFKDGSTQADTMDLIKINNKWKIRL